MAKKQAPIVEHVTSETMAGDSVLEKTLNSILTRAFIVFCNAPTDECLDEARTLIKANFNKEQLVQYFKDQFGGSSDLEAHRELIADIVIGFINNLKDS